MDIRKEQKKQKVKRLSGYSLVELLIVLCIITVLAAVAIGHYQKYFVRSEIGYALGIVDIVKRDILEYYYTVGRWPKKGQPLHNESLYSSSDKTSAVGQQDFTRHLDRIIFDTDGVVNVWFRKDGRMQQYVNDPVLTLRPVMTKGNGPGTIFWLCGNAEPPDNAVVLGENRTNIPDDFLITNCKRK
jgi:type IV pilus assembly protein PilA